MMSKNDSSALRSGWLKRGLASARYEFEQWPKSVRDRIENSNEFRIKIMKAPVVKLSLAERFLNWYPSHTKLYIRGQQGKDWETQRVLDLELAKVLNPFLEKIVNERVEELVRNLVDNLPTCQFDKVFGHERDWQKCGLPATWADFDGDWYECDQHHPTPKEQWEGEVYELNYAEPLRKLLKKLNDW